MYRPALRSTPTCSAGTLPRLAIACLVCTSLVACTTNELVTVNIYDFPDASDASDASQSTPTSDAAVEASPAIDADVTDVFASVDAPDIGDGAPAHDAGPTDATDASVVEASTDASLAQMDLPVTFEDPTIAYALLGFAGAEDSTIVADPTLTSNHVAKVNRSAIAATYAGTTLTDAAGDGFAHPLAFDAGNTRIRLRTYVPAAGIHVRVKVEDHTDPTVSVETEALSTMANAWETLTFDFASQAAGTAALVIGKRYDKATVFFDFNQPGSTLGARTYYFDDMVFVGGTGGSTPPPASTWAPITFDDSATTYTLTDFGGALGTVITDPTAATNKVAQVIKPATAQAFAGDTVSTLGGASNLLVPTLPITASRATMTVRVYAPATGIDVKLKVEDGADPTHSVETDVKTTAVGWQTLTFDFATPATGTAALNPAYTFDKLSLFFDFGAGAGGTPLAADATYLFDDVTFL